MKNLDESVRTCLSNMKTSEDFSEMSVTNSFSEVLSCIIESPAQLINYSGEEKLSLILSSILTSPFPQRYPTINGIDVRNLVFAAAYYLFMHQLETGNFYDRNWPAFILLIHIGRREFAKFSGEMNPFASERIHKIMGEPIDYSRFLNSAKGVELNMMLRAKRTGNFTVEMESWFNELCSEGESLLNSNPFKTVAIPLYRFIETYLKADDITFVNELD